MGSSSAHFAGRQKVFMQISANYGVAPQVECTALTHEQLTKSIPPFEAMQFLRYAIVQLGHTTVGYAPKRPMTATVSEGKLKAPHWFYREDYRPRMQMRISERNSMLNVRKIDYGREKPVST